MGDPTGGPAQTTRFCLKAINDEERLVFAWANVMVTADGRPIPQPGIDGYTDVFPVAVVEKAAHEFLLQSREGGAMHQVGGVATVVESLVWTAEKAAALGVAADALPQGWLVTMQVHDDATWQDIKAGRLAMLSIQGVAEREPVAA